MRRTNLLLTLVMLCFVCGCSGGNRNVIRGDADYPVENPDPKVVSVISGIMPTDLNVAFTAYYGANEDKERSCAYYENGYLRFEGAPRWYSVSEPLSVTLNNGRFSISVVSDRYLPGRCNWALRGIQMFVAGTAEEPFPTWIFYDRGKGAVGAKHMDMWCKKSKTWKVRGDSAIECSYFKEELRGKVSQPSSLAISSDSGQFVLDFHFQR
jgi:hypothetical protein